MDLIYYLYVCHILFVVLTCLIYFRNIYHLQMVLAMLAFHNFLYFNVLYRSYHVNDKVIYVAYILKYYYTGILFVVLCERWFCVCIYSQEPAMLGMDGQGLTKEFYI